MKKAYSKPVLTKSPVTLQCVTAQVAPVSGVLTKPA